MNRYQVIWLTALLGCAHSSTPQPSEPVASSGAEQQQLASADAAESECCMRCPLALSGATLTYAESSGGGSMVFSAPDAELEQLRQRVQELATYHNQNQRKLAMMTMPHEARAVTTDSGARIEFTTPVNNDLAALQREIENEVQWMQGGRCALAGEKCSCQLGQSSPLSGSSPTQAPTDDAARDENPALPTHP